MTAYQRDTLHIERYQYQEKRGNNNYGYKNRYLEKMQRKINVMKSSMRFVPGDIPSGTISHISQLTGGNTIIGGQNKQ